MNISTNDAGRLSLTIEERFADLSRAVRDLAIEVDQMRFAQRVDGNLGVRLINAIKKYDWAEFSNIIDVAAGSLEILHFRGDDGTTPLSVAAGLRAVPERIIQRLLDVGASVDVQDKDGSTPLMHAARVGNLKALEVLFGANADLNKYNKQGTTALMFATTFGHRDIAERLVGEGALLDEQDANGDTALILAATSKSHDIYQFFIEQGANQEIKNNERRSARDYVSHCSLM